MASVYFLIMYDPADPAHDFGLVKVGITEGDVADRIAQLQTGNPHELRCVTEFETPCARSVEHFVHRAHAAEMHHLEWLRWPRDRIATLVDEAKRAARRIEDLKLKEEGLASRVTNSKERRPTSEETELHREVQALKRNLVPAELRLKVAEGWLHAATGTTHGIQGIVRVTRAGPTARFNARQAEATFPMLAERCRVENVSGSFFWRKVPVPWHFVAENQAAEEATIAAEAAASGFLARNAEPDGWTPRTAEFEQMHDEFLLATQLVTRLDADLASMQSELTLRLDEYDALVGVCSYVRRARSRVDAIAFCQTYPDQAAKCMETVVAQLRKHVYPTRSYWSDSALRTQELIAGAPR
jgi:Meiotically up-regulated gene 113